MIEYAAEELTPIANKGNINILKGTTCHDGMIRTDESQ